LGVSGYFSRKVSKAATFFDSIATCSSSVSERWICSTMVVEAEFDELEQFGATQTIFSREAYLYGRCAFLVTKRTSLVTKENMSSIEIGFWMFRKSA
jgi:hypothetical protein